MPLARCDIADRAVPMFLVVPLHETMNPFTRRCQALEWLVRIRRCVLYPIVAKIAAVCCLALSSVDRSLLHPGFSRSGPVEKLADSGTPSDVSPRGGDADDLAAYARTGRLNFG
jgi:hypothetical protein